MITFLVILLAILTGVFLVTTHLFVYTLGQIDGLRIFRNTYKEVQDKK